MKKPNFSIPVLFQKIEECETTDTRFVKVKIWLMHLQENFNGSYFDKEVVKKAIPSLANTPILGFIEQNSNNEEDFSDHRRIMIKNSDGDWNFKYLGNAFGVIPESNNAQFEWRLCDDGKTREFLTVEGLMWTKWEEPIDILNRDAIKSHSMELHEKSIEGYFDMKDELFHITNFQFFGACILGLDYSPAMRNSTAELQDYSFEDFKKEMQTKMEEYKLFQLSNNEGGSLMKKKLELLTKFSKTEEDIKDMGINLETISYEELENKLNKEVLDNNSPENKEDLEKNSNSGEEENKEDKEKEGDEGKKEDKDSEINEKGIDYQKLYENLEKDYEELKENFVTLEKDTESLREFKKNRLIEDRKADEGTLFEKYKMLDGIEEFENLKEKSSNFSTIEDLEKEVALIFAKKYTKLNFSREEGEEKNKFNFDNNEKRNSKYGDLFDRYGK